MHLGFESGGPLHGCVHVLLKDPLLDRQIESLLLDAGTLSLAGAAERLPDVVGP